MVSLGDFAPDAVVGAFGSAATCRSNVAWGAICDRNCDKFYFAPYMTQKSPRRSQ